MEQVQYYIYSLSRNSNKPLDYRDEVSSISKIDEEIPLNYRYLGMIIFDKSTKTHHTFKDSLTNLIPLSESIINNMVFSLSSSNYSTLNNDLNNLNSTSSVGRIITILPLKVSFMFDGINWNYHSGIYTVNDLYLINSIPNNLRKHNAIIEDLTNRNLSSSNRYRIFNSDLSVGSFLTLINSDSNSSFQNIITSTIFDNQRYYLIDNMLFYFLNNKLFRIGKNIFIHNNYELNQLNKYQINIENDINKINHNLKSTKLCIYLEVIIDKVINTVNNSIINVTKLIKCDDYLCIDINNVQIYCDYKNLTGNLIITTV